MAAPAITELREEILAAGKRLEARSFIPEDRGRPTIVLLHEGLGSVALWKDLPRQVATVTRCGVFVYSRYGYGESDLLMEKRSVSYMHYEAEVVLPELLEKAAIQRPILLGHSDGASIALIYAGFRPDSPRGLILEAPHVFVEGLTIESIAAAGTAYRETDLPRRLSKYHQDADRTFWGWNNIWLDPAFRSWNIEEYLDAIRCPVLVIQGENDEYGTTAQIDAIQRRRPETQVLMLPECGHSPHRDQTAATLEGIRSFTESVVR